MRSSARATVERGRRRLFERLVVRALDGLPPEIHAMLDNVEVVVEDEPGHSALDGDEGPEELFGLYEGTPLTERTSYSLQLPDKITIFRGPLQRSFPSQADQAVQVRITVVHELAHHLGIGEERLAELGWE